MQRRHGPEHASINALGPETDQIGVIELILGRRRQLAALDEKPRPVQRLRRVAVGNFIDPREKIAFLRAY
jgi:hypothetical protein